ncbi:triple tyrosine motif-containing protein [Larkinella bovis]|uniref:Triple tyrosine motif-containing protein n=1 Tax=Larkinella bovis TaxID=683041 RepID=A0ABW0I656_9BACT
MNTPVDVGRGRGWTHFGGVFWLYLLSFFQGVFAQETPPLTNYTSAVYNAHNQNWAVSQSSDQLLYVANSDGLLEYDGANWKVYPLPDHQIVRSVLCDDVVKTGKKPTVEHRIYVGGFAEFGYWLKGVDGELTYHSLSKTAAFKSLKTEEIWHILKTPDYIYFQSFSRIYRYDGHNLTEIKAFGNFMFLRYVRNRLLIQLIGHGLFELKGETFSPVPNTDVLSPSTVSSILPFPGNRILITTTKNGLYILEDDRLRPWTIGISRELQTNLLNQAIQLRPDSSYVFGTIQQGVYLVSATGVLQHQFNQKNGLQNNTVLALGQDNSHNLWIGLDKGIDLIKTSSPIVYSQANDNPLGSTYAAAIWRGNFYVGSNNGVFVKKWGAKEPFKPIPGLGGQTWSLKVIDDQLLCGHNDATFRIDKKGARRISDVTGGWVFLPLKTPTDSVILQGAYNGLHVYRKNRQQEWSYSHSVKGIPPLPIRQIIQDQDGSFWLVHAYKGLYRTRLTVDLDSALSWRDYKSPRDLPSEFSIELTEWAGQLRIRAGSRFFVADAAGNLKPDTTLPMDEEDAFKIRAGLAGDWFKLYKNRVLYYRRDAKPQSFDLSLVRNYETILPISANDYLFCLDNGYGLYNRLHDSLSLTAMPQPIIRKVANWRNLTEVFSLLPKVVLPPDVRSIRISYALPVYGQNVQYRYRLSGLSDQWSEWTSQSSVEYTNLEATSYTFEVRTNLSDRVTTYAFAVAPRWFETWWAKTVFIILVSLALIGLIIYQEKRLVRHRQKLLAEQEEKLRQQRLSSERKIIELQNEKLQSEIKNKSQQLSNVAINVVRKNEILEEIRDELKQVKDEMGQQFPNIHYQKLLNSIERNVAGKEDWVLFEENFDEVHEEFFKRLRALCPSITPTELRLAACLRMNLSTKEMAPAMGISIRGVEIKRYRLRKKLGLDNHANLVEFMMEV